MSIIYVLFTSVPPTRIATQLFGMLSRIASAVRFQIFHEKTLPTTFSASARSSRKSSSPLRRLFTLHPNTLSCPVQCRYLQSPRYIPTCPLQNSRSPAFARSSTRHISSPSLQISFIGYPSLISASRQIKTPFTKYAINTTPEQSIPSAAFPPHRY